MPVHADLSAQLQDLLEAADFDGALSLVRKWDIRSVVRKAGKKQTRLTSIVADVLDYGGDYDIAKQILNEFLIDRGNDPRKRQDAYLKAHRAEAATVRQFSDSEANDRKEEAWAVIQLGMSRYRDRGPI